MSRGLATLALAAVTVSAMASAASCAPSDAEALALVRRYNQRDIGVAGHERVTLLLKRDNTIFRTLELARLYVRRANSIRTVVSLLEPKPLAGLAYLIAEDIAAENAQLHLFMPAGSRIVLELRPSRFFEGLLGADFSYDDLRWTLPENGWTYRQFGSRSIAGRATSGVVGTVAGGEEHVAAAFRTTVQWFDDKTGMILRREFYRAVEALTGSASPDKVLDLTASRCIDGVNRPVGMRMAAADGNTTELILRSADYEATTVAWSMLAAETLPEIGQVATASSPRAMPAHAPGRNWSGVELCDAK